MKQPLGVRPPAVKPMSQTSQTRPPISAQRANKGIQRLDWLRAHPALLARLPGANDDVEPAGSEALDEALRAMRLVKLWGASTPTTNARWGIRLAVSEIRGQHVGDARPASRSRSTRWE